MIAVARCVKGTRVLGFRVAVRERMLSDAKFMRATADYVLSNVVDLYNRETGLWSTARLSQPRSALSATSVGTVAIFAGGCHVFTCSKLLKIALFVVWFEGMLIAVVRCVMGTRVFVFRVAVREQLLSYARHCRSRIFQSCGLVQQGNRTMVDGSAQSGAPESCSDICWNGGHLRRGLGRQVVEDCVFLLCEGMPIAVLRCVMGTLVLVYGVAWGGRFLSDARHCRLCFFQCCGLVRQWNRTMVDGSAQSGAQCSFRDICWNGGHLRRG